MLYENTVIQDWIAATLVNSWVNYAATTNPAGYFKDPFGIVHLRGVVKDGTIPAIVFTLPAGFRPQYNEYFQAMSYTGAADTQARTIIFTDGRVEVHSGNNYYVGFDGITFRAI